MASTKTLHSIVESYSSRDGCDRLVDRQIPTPPCTTVGCRSVDLALWQAIPRRPAVRHGGLTDCSTDARIREHEGAPPYWLHGRGLRDAARRGRLSAAAFSSARRIIHRAARTIRTATANEVSVSCRHGFRRTAGRRAVDYCDTVWSGLVVGCVVAFVIGQTFERSRDIVYGTRRLVENTRGALAVIRQYRHCSVQRFIFRLPFWPIDRLSRRFAIVV